MLFDIVTIFPKIFDSYKRESIIKRAQEKRLIKIRIHNLRDWTSDRHKTVDDRPFGGGLGMVIKIEPVFKAIRALKKPKVKSFSSAKASAGRSQFARIGYLKGVAGGKSKVVLFSPRGKLFNQKMAYRFSKLNQIIMLCGRYEGVDERVAKHIADEEISIGNYDLMGGELPAMILVETVARLIPGVLGKKELLKERITREKGFIEYSQYTRPKIFSFYHYVKDKRGKRTRKETQWQTPKVLLSGNHKKIEDWREKHGKIVE